METTKRTSVFGNGLIWFGAGVSIAEILTGTLFAPMGFWKATAAIVLGHVIGCILLYFAGLVGARYSRSAMESAKLSFGRWGGSTFAALNVIQLVGWTAVMIASGAQSAQTALPWHGGPWLWSVLTGVLILVWILAGIGVLQRINIVTMALLFGLSLLLSRLVFAGQGAGGGEGLSFGAALELSIFMPGEELSFGAALEFSIAMPVSWLPLIADYTSNSERPKVSCLVSSLTYFVVSCWMYMIGMAAALFFQETEIAAIMLKANLGVAALVIVILSTVTTTFLDVYSAGISAESIWQRLPPKAVAAAVCVIGTVLAIFCDTSSFESFLYWIGSVFVPMITVQIMDVFVCGCANSERRAAIANMALWGVGFILYRVALALELPCGSTIPVVVVTAVLCWLVRRLVDGRPAAQAVSEG